MTDIKVREAGPADALAVADLQIASWRSAYRGMLTDTYLAGPIEAERRGLWQRRFQGARSPDQVVIVAEDGNELVGLACILAGHDPKWGSLVDNLHVAPDRKRTGIGRLVLAEAARRVPAAHAHRAVHLTVLETNVAAQAAYERWGGELTERLNALEPDGQSLPVRRYSWQSPAELLARLEREAT